MNIFSQKTIQELCRKYDLSPSKKYGQNFLINPAPTELMIDAAEIGKKDTIIEIGPGFGALSFALLKKTSKVVAFEIEKKLADYWEGKLDIIWGNVLYQDDFSSFGKYKVVANLPYQITSAVIRKFLEADNKPEIMVLMVQKEVAQRICAQTGDMSVLSIAIQYYSEAEIVTDVSRNSFWPSPAVDSAVIKLKINPKFKHNKEQTKFYFNVVKSGFSSKRKMLVNNLINAFGKDKKQAIIDVLTKIELDQKCRAQELSLQQWKKLAQMLESVV